jgi:hypothetical protein
MTTNERERTFFYRSLHELRSPQGMKIPKNQSVPHPNPLPEGEGTMRDIFRGGNEENEGAEVIWKAPEHWRG